MPGEEESGQKERVLSDKNNSSRFHSEKGFEIWKKLVGVSSPAELQMDVLWGWDLKQVSGL